jgi:pSer/pThr/pTyr-binding forkhead associated (FHA) protein
MDVRLKVLIGGNAGQEIRVPGPKFFIGRSEECHLRPRSDLISRHHCVLLVDETAVTLRDFGSKNGSFINGQRVSGEQDLRQGDKLRIGPLEFELSIAEEPAAKKRPKVQSIKEAVERTAADSDKTGMDVDEWLMAGGTVAKDAETRIIEGSDTEEIVAADEATLAIEDTPAPAAVKPAAAQVASVKPAPAEPKKPAKAPSAAAPKGGADSGKAAADVLKKFFQRR